MQSEELKGHTAALLSGAKREPPVNVALIESKVSFDMKYCAVYFMTDNTRSLECEEVNGADIINAAVGSANYVDKLLLRVRHSTFTQRR